MLNVFCVEGSGKVIKALKATIVACEQRRVNRGTVLLVVIISRWKVTCARKAENHLTGCKCTEMKSGSSHQTIGNIQGMWWHWLRA